MEKTIAIIDEYISNNKFAKNNKKINKKFDKVFAKIRIANSDIKEINDQIEDLKNNEDNLFIEKYKCRVYQVDVPGVLKWHYWRAEVNGIDLDENYIFRFSAKKAAKKYANGIRSIINFKEDKYGCIIEEEFYV